MLHRVPSIALDLLTLTAAVAAAGFASGGWFVVGGVFALFPLALLAVEDRVGTERDVLGRFSGALVRVGALAAVAIGMAVYAIRFEKESGAEFAGALALAGLLVVAYARVRSEASLGRKEGGGGPAWHALLLIEEFLMLAVMAITMVVGQCFWGLWTVAALSGLAILVRLVLLRGMAAGQTATSSGG